MAGSAGAVGAGAVAAVSEGVAAAVAGVAAAVAGDLVQGPTGYRLLSSIPLGDSYILRLFLVNKSLWRRRQ